MRIGTGIDVHRLVTGRRLVIGGVDIPHDRGLQGHSDADVLVHAICDAVLGAAGLGDIGMHFPDSDPAFRHIDSLRLLEQTVAMAREKGWDVENIDATIIAQAPAMAPYRREMTENIARAAGVAVTQVNVKATTTEGLGLTGRQEGIAAMSTVLLQGGQAPLD